MATYFWVGGTGNWDATNTHWASISGGAGGAGVPTSADDVVFDSASNATAYTVTLTTAPVCRSVTITGPASGNVTVAGSAAWSIYGSMTLAATGITRTYNGAITFAATTTGWFIGTNGVSLASAITFNGSGGGWTLATALTTTSAFTVAAGSFSTGNFALSVGSLISTGALTRSISLGSSAVTISTSTGTVVNLVTTGLTFTAGTSTITVSGYAATVTASGITFYNISFTRASSIDGDSLSITGSFTCNNLSYTSSATGVVNITLTNGITVTINGTFSGTTTQIARTFFRTSTYGSTATISLASNATITNTDFRDIVVSGAGSITSAVGCGDTGGNSGITFPASKTVYWNLAGSQNWSATGWATAPTGAPALANFPLAQDTAIFTDNNPTASTTITVNGVYNLPAIDFSSRTLALTFATGTKSPFIYGSLTLSSAMAVSGTGGITFGNRSNTATITSAGKTWTQQFAFSALGTTVYFGDAFTSSNTLTHSYGTLDAQTYNVTCPTFSTSASTTRTLNLGSGTWTIIGSGASAWLSSNTTGLTLNAGTSTISLTSASAKSFIGGAKTYYNLNQGGAGALTISGSNTFNNITNSVQPTTVTFTASTTQTVSSFSLIGTAGNLVTINSSTAGTQATLSKTSGTVSCDYLSVRDSNATGGAGWYAGANSTNVSNNTGWIFTAPPPSVLSITENSSLADAYTVITNFISSQTEVITAGDSSTQTYGYTQTITENVALDDYSTQTYGYTQTITENVALDDYSTQTSTFLQSLIENVALDDYSTQTYEYMQAVIETLVLGDSSTQQSAFLQSLTENVNIADVATVVAAFQGSITEALTSLDAAEVSQGVYATLVENLTSGDSAAAQRTVYFSIAENVTLADSSTQVCQFYFTQIEPITVLTHLEVHGWIKIPDQQNANWQAISDGQTPNWTAVNDTQNPDWTPVQDAQ